MWFFHCVSLSDVFLLSDALQPHGCQFVIRIASVRRFFRLFFIDLQKRLRRNSRHLCLPYALPSSRLFAIEVSLSRSLSKVSRGKVCYIKNFRKEKLFPPLFSFFSSILTQEEQYNFSAKRLLDETFTLKYLIYYQFIWSSRNKFVTLPRCLV